MYKVLCTLPVDADNKKAIEAAGPGCTFKYVLQGDVKREDLLDVDIILGNLSPSLLTDLPRLKFLQLDSAGSDGYAKLPIFQGEGAPLLANATGTYGVTISEYMVGSIIMLIRHFQVYRDQMKEHRWQRIELPTCISGHKALVIGLGDIGTNFAMRMKAFGASVTAIRRTEGEKPDYIDRVGTLKDLPEMLAEADFVGLCLPNSPETTKIINRETLALMKPEAILVNVGRGSAVDYMALAEALKEGKLAGAALDVTDPEPLPEDHPLWDCRNCLITPHVAGLFQQEDPFRKIVARCAANLEHFLKNEPCESVVDINTGYRVSRS